MTENDISYKVIGCALEVHKALGPGLLESAYQTCLFYELNRSGLFVEMEKPMPVIYQGVRMECGYRIDILVERKVVIEIKSVETLHNVHKAQVLTYMRLGNYRLGLLINFNVARLTHGIERLIDGNIE